MDYMRKCLPSHVPRWAPEHQNSPLALIQKSDPKTDDEAAMYTKGVEALVKGVLLKAEMEQEQTDRAEVMKRLNK
jgi:hypothetical protein